MTPRRTYLGSVARTLGAASALVLFVACGGAPLAPSPPSDAGTLQYSTTNFIFHYSASDGSAIQAIAAAADAEHDRIVSDLQAASMLIVHVRYYPTYDALAAAVRPLAGEIPAWASGLVTGPDQIHLLSPAAAGATAQAAAGSVVHEFSHCVTLHVAPRAGNNPRWLWESVAQFEARQFVDPARIPYLVAGQPPSLAELSSFDNTRVYDVGYVIGEFIVQRWGQSALASLIRSFGDTQATLGITTAEFDRAWYAAVREKYGL